MEVSGTATRWPGRLADDCDRIISVWTAKFGRLEEIYPFMYGRGGRLEGVASLGEFSKGALLARWQSACPEKLMPKQSRRHGDLGFKAGAWWINSLFAHHAGIIDLEASEGGICHDRYGAYALLLKNSSELDPISETSFLYRPSQGDRGTYRLTAATSKSRQPIRVLRSHSLNSVWGPKAGVRYEGLFRVTGWKILPLRPVSGMEHHEDHVRDIIFEIHFEREDITPIEEVFRHPLAAELDDYTEYKRLRRYYHEHRIERRHLDIGTVQTPMCSKQSLTVSTKAASLSPTSSRTTTLKLPSTGAAPPVPPSLHSPASARSFMFSHVREPAGESCVSPERKLRLVPSRTLMKSTSIHPRRPRSSGIDSGVHARNKHSKPSQASPRPDIKEVAPWVEISNEDHKREANSPKQMLSPRQSRLSHRRTTDSLTEESSSSLQHQESGKDDRNHPRSHFALRAKPSQRAVSRSRNPLAKLFDGVEEIEEAASANRPPLGVGTGGIPQRAISVSLGNSTPISRKQRASSTSGCERVVSPVPFRPLSPASRLIGARRQEIVAALADSIPISGSPELEDPFVQSGRSSGDSISLQAFISAPHKAIPVHTSPEMSPSPRSRTPCSDSMESGSSPAETALRAVNDGKPMFRDPFKGVYIR